MNVLGTAGRRGARRAQRSWRLRAALAVTDATGGGSIWWRRGSIRASGVRPAVARMTVSVPARGRTCAARGPDIWRLGPLDLASTGGARDMWRRARQQARAAARGRMCGASGLVAVNVVHEPGRSLDGLVTHARPCSCAEVAVPLVVPRAEQHVAADGRHRETLRASLKRPLLNANVRLSSFNGGRRTENMVRIARARRDRDAVLGRVRRPAACGRPCRPEDVRVSVARVTGEWLPGRLVG